MILFHDRNWALPTTFALTERGRKPKLKPAAGRMGASSPCELPQSRLSMQLQDRVTMIPYHWQYLPLLLQVLVAFGLGLAMVVASWFVGRHRNTAVKLAAYECGIVPVGDARGRFSVRFYMVAMLFILFDVEAVFMMPWAVIYRKLPGHHRPAALRLLGDGRLPRFCGRGTLLHRAQRHPRLEHGQGGPLAWRD